MDSLTVTLTSHRHIDGYITAANRAGMTPEALVLEFLAQQGARYADDFNIGIITGAEFISRFTPPEYTNILFASETNETVAGLISELIASPNVHLDDPRLTQGLELLVSLGLLTQDRSVEISSYSRPAPEQ